MEIRFFVVPLLVIISWIILIDIVFDKPDKSRYHITCLDGIEYWESNIRDVLAVRIDVVTMQPARCICK